MRGFTLVELVVSIAIFGFMTALMVAKYGNFNQSVLLTNLAYDVALTVRTAQTYGISVKGAESGGSDDFKYAYGVHFDTADSKNVTMFQTLPPTYTYCGSNNGCDVSVYAVTRGANISSVCAGVDAPSCALNQGTKLDVTFKRPDPSAIICLGSDCSKTYAEVVIKGTDNSIRTVSVRQNGQVSVLQ